MRALACLLALSLSGCIGTTVDAVRGPDGEWESFSYATTSDKSVSLVMTLDPDGKVVHVEFSSNSDSTAALEHQKELMGLARSVASAGVPGVP